MTDDDDRAKNIDGVQGLATLVGITLGLVPLIRLVFGGQVGSLLHWFPTARDEVGQYVVPASILLVAGVVIVVAERAKARG